MRITNPRFQIRYRFHVHVEHLSATDTPDMIVVLKGKIESIWPIRNLYLPYISLFGQNSEIPINGSLSDSRMILFDERIDLISRYMAVHFTHGFKDKFSSNGVSPLHFSLLIRNLS